MNPRLIDWIWHIRGSLALAPEQSGDDALDKLAPLFRQTGTSHDRTNDTLTFRKKATIRCGPSPRRCSEPRSMN